MDTIGRSGTHAAFRVAVLTFLKGKGVKLYYNRTMALLYNIDPETIDSNLTPLGLKEMTALFGSVDRSIGY